MEVLPTVVVSGVLFGGVYAIIALGLSLIFGVMKVIHFAYGSFLMLGMFGVFYTSSLFGVDPYLSVVIVAPLLFGLSYLTQKFLTEPLYKRERGFVIDPLSVFLVMAGLWMVLDNLGLYVFGPDFRTVNGITTDKSFQILDVIVNVPRLVAFAVAIVLCLALHLLMTHTELGRVIRATSQDRETAAVCGVDVYRTFGITFGLSGVTLAIAAACLAPFFYIQPSVGWPFALKSFMLVVLGGTGSIPGTLLAGIFLGVVEALAAHVAAATYAQVVFFVLFVVVLLFRPYGLLGKETL